MSTLQQRVLRERAKREREEKLAHRRAEAPANRRMGQAVARANREDALLDGRAEPRNRREADLVMRAEVM